MLNKTYIKEIFESVQGEGPYVGVNQLFIRFSRCNLQCKYCDTDFKSDLKLYTAIELSQEVIKYKNIHSVSLTGGEPLLETPFLSEFLPLINKKIYLETNGVLFENLKSIINYIDIISMDIKLKSSSKNTDLFDCHSKFAQIANENKKEIFFKIVFDENITEKEIINCINIAEKYNNLIVLQPKMNGNNMGLSSYNIKRTFNIFINNYKNTRLIPQVHKFINVQ